MTNWRTILACLLVLTGSIRPVGACGRAQAIRLGPAAAQAAGNAAAERGFPDGVRATHIGDSLILEFSSRRDVLIAWARAHDIDLPDGDDRPLLSAAEATVTADRADTPNDNAEAAYAETDTDVGRSRRLARSDHRPAPAPRLAPLADRFGLRAPPSA